MNTATGLALADIGAGQWGLVTTPQAVAAGLNRMQLSRLNEVGILTRLTHGVYALRSSTGQQHQDLAAAWLSLDPARLAHERLADLSADAVVSHASAAVLHGLGDLDADRHEFTTTTRKQTRRPELRLHRGVLARDDITRRDGLPVTTPARTVVDLLADGHDLGHVASVLTDAVRTRQVDLDELIARTDQHAARFGFAVGDGHALVRHLLALGGAEEQVDAEQLAATARAQQRSISEFVGDRARQDRLVETLAAMATQQTQITSAFAQLAAHAELSKLDAVAEVVQQLGVVAQSEDLRRQLEQFARAASPALRAVAEQTNAASPPSVSIDIVRQSEDLRRQLEQFVRAAGPALRAAAEQMNRAQPPITVRLPPAPQIPDGALTAVRAATAHLASSLSAPPGELDTAEGRVLHEVNDPAQDLPAEDDSPTTGND